MPCSEALRVHAYFDGELDASAAAEIERHLENCPDCAALLADLDSMRRTLRDAAPYYRANDALHRSIAGALDAESGDRAPRAFARRRNSFFAGVLSGGGLTAIAAMLIVIFLVPQPGTMLVGDLTDAHLRSLMTDRLIDVASSDRHTVKPWFAGRTDVSPPAFDFAGQGFSLIGGRADYVTGRRAAVVVYRHGKHVINVFAWVGGDENLPDAATRNGYHLLFWKSGNVAFCAVSDAAPDELAQLARLIRENSGSRE